ncbi:MAG: DUF1559 domain-containing protein [Pirellulaceae bacterium]|nr:DUF1559 domain-containing protein [Pirellulaceae bacterium]
MTSKYRKAFTIVELLIVIAIIGLLTAILMPAINSARESARRTQCVNRLRQLAIAAEHHHSVHQAFPPARLLARPGDPNQCGGAEATWLVRILPYLEEQAVYAEWDLYRPWYEQPAEARNPKVVGFICPSRRGLDRALVTRDVPQPGAVKTMRSACGCTFTVPDSEAFETVSGVVTDYAANHGDLSPGATGDESDFYYGGNGTGTIITSRPACRGGQPTNWIDRISSKKIKDGLSKTFLIGERHVPRSRIQAFPEDPPAFDGDYLGGFARVAGPGAPIAFGASDEGASPLAFGSAHSQVCNFAMADCSVVSLSTDTNTRLLEKLSHRNNGSSLASLDR